MHFPEIFKEVVEANNLTSEAVAKRNVVLAKVNGLEELVSVLRSEIKIAKEGHSDARKAKQEAESLRELRQTTLIFQNISTRLQNHCNLLHTANEDLGTVL